MPLAVAPILLLLASGGASPAPAAEVATVVTAADGTAVHVYEYRPSSRSRGLPLLMFHQAGGDARGELGPIARRLAAEGRRVFTADLRSGGSRFGGTNLTAAGYKGPQQGYCHVYPDLEAALDHVRKKTGKRAIVAGSSYSGALVVQLAARRSNHVAGFVSFSPAGGPAMAPCEPEPHLASLRVPGLAVRNRTSQPPPPWMAESNRRWRAAGVPVMEIEAEGHGASLLLPERTKGDVDSIWRAFRAFLARVDGK